VAVKKNIPMRVVKEETGLTSRQIRYYDETGLVFPERTRGNQRLFSEEDIIRLKKIKSLLEEGYTIEAIKSKICGITGLIGGICHPDFLFQIN
jgi:MerR family glutamine synthetase transcriptional repressor